MGGVATAATRQSFAVQPSYYRPVIYHQYPGRWMAR